MKKAVITSGGKQYLVAVGEVIEVDLMTPDKNISFDALLTLDDNDVQVGTPVLSTKVTAEVVAADIKADKVTAIRYKAKKRVHKVRGHRQHHTVVKITKIG